MSLQFTQRIALPAVRRDALDDDGGPDCTMGRVESFKLRRGTWINGYQILEPLGRGWEGEVYRVREKYYRASRALKLFAPAPGSNGCPRFAVSSVSITAWPSAPAPSVRGSPGALVGYLDLEAIVEWLARQRASDPAR